MTGPWGPVGVPTLVASAEPREGCPTPWVFTSVLNYILKWLIACYNICQLLIKHLLGWWFTQDRVQTMGPCWCAHVSGEC